MLIKLLVTFFKIGLFTFGGGYAMLPLLEREIVDKHKWLTSDELVEFYAIAQSTPGIIAINTATYVGYKNNKTIGAIISVIGMVLPSFIIIILIALLNNSLSDNSTLEAAFFGISVSVSILILNSVLGIMKKNVNTLNKFIAFLLIVLVAYFTNVHIVIIIIITSILSLILNIKKVGDR